MKEWWFAFQRKEEIYTNTYKHITHTQHAKYIFTWSRNTTTTKYWAVQDTTNADRFAIASIIIRSFHLNEVEYIILLWSSRHNLYISFALKKKEKLNLKKTTYNSTTKMSCQLLCSMQFYSEHGKFRIHMRERQSRKLNVYKSSDRWMFIFSSSSLNGGTSASVYVFVFSC